MIVFTTHQISTCQSESSLDIGAGSFFSPSHPFQALVSFLSILDQLVYL